MSDNLGKAKLAAVQASSVFLDREASIEKACAIIREAGANGADLIGFPEGFIPAHPTWFHFLPTSSPKALGFSRDLFLNSVEIPGPATEALCRACREANVIAVIGVCEKIPDTTGTMYNTQLFIDRTGAILGKHQKIMPTLGERIVHTGGFGDTMRAYRTPFGNVGGLICGENLNPLAIFSLAAMNTVVHVASWPAHFNHGTWMQDCIEIASRAIGYQMKAFVINGVGVVSDEMIEAYAQTDEDRAYMERAKGTGAATIVGPKGQDIAGPLEPGDGILYAEVDLDGVLIPKVTQDFGGHYNRFDIFSLHVNVDAPHPLVHLRSKPPAGELEGPAEPPLLGEGGEDPSNAEFRRITQRDG